MEVSSSSASSVQTNAPTPRQEVERRPPPQSSQPQTLSSPEPSPQTSSASQAADPNQRVGSIVDVQV
ncbi:hypothetical protein [Paraglaciecola mesophila]|jgi:hypothetical protein|uniref:hypothetical protein n=1 Tax=Paraglaciecola mesophila TaxID=197222 RepID=UPI000586DD09|nr:hypothetical protein [Paraglaciecola mesophila]